MLTFTNAYHHSLDNNLVLKSLANQQDIERLAAFNGQIFGQDVSEMTRALILNHPPARPEYWLFIEDESNGQIVSSLALIPWLWRYEDVTLKSGEMGIVGTLEAYRNKGLIRALDRRFKELLREGEFDLSHIQGIPYFYRQFGYEYALPLNAPWEIELQHIPALPTDSPYYFRLATVDDIPTLMRLYDEAAGSLDISTLRDTDIWQCIFEQPSGSALITEVWLVLDAAQQIVGYWRITAHGFGSGLLVSETSRLGNSAAIALLQQLKAIALERNKPNIRLDVPDNNDLLQVARGYGAHDMGSYAWQIHLVDVVRLLRKLAPVLERRIAASLFAGLSQKVKLNLYRETFELHFEGGKLLAVNNIGFQDGGDIRIPPNLMTPLLLGHRSREELCKSYPDVAIWGQAQHLIDVLFPKMRGFIYSNY
jgi:predicted acetyltransferase